MEDKRDRTIYYAQNKERILKREKEYREQHRDEINASAREKYATNKEKESVRKKKARKDNREKILERERIRREANREKLREQQRLYRQTEHSKEYLRRYYQENKVMWTMTREKKDRANANDRKRRRESEEERLNHIREATEWRVNNPLKAKTIKLRKYGMTLKDFNTLLEFQEHKCSICGFSDKSIPVRFPVVDHCHNGNHVRGLLCGSCNRGLGQFRDDIEVMKKAIAYLEANSLCGPLERLREGRNV